MNNFESNCKAILELKAWRKRQDRCNGFSKNKHKDGSDVLEDNYDAIIRCLERYSQPLSG